jgi:hypothetical protein
LFAVFPLVSTLAGLFVRERLLHGTAYAYPTAGFMAKRLVEDATLAFILWITAPAPDPNEGFDLCDLEFLGLRRGPADEAVRARRRVLARFLKSLSYMTSAP